MSETYRPGDVIKCPRCKGRGIEPKDLLDLFTFWTNWDCTKCGGRGLIKVRTR